ncbi:relaxase/mobilization nuclease domain-containing protein [Sphingobacterium sp. WM]|uniref:relaxase/mobilization nuclease domain-containing protein n=1 Tax=Sphingobacterium sp. WM TaxID=3031802 RepID=UPI00240E5CEF|nr:relaxase/mobilization nuclease domain-containing protein [Sphingobacterium sp. WM]WFB65010.1 relaxase/mobilization nuclease domain-containing protein [Sphingobacterium sp. WM]
MIAKIINSKSGFSASLDYVLNRDQSKIIHTENVRLGDSKFIALQLKTLAQCNDRIKNPLGHIVLSFSKDWNNKLSDDIMRMIAQDYLMKLGIRDTGLVVVRHEDRKHPHCHIIFSKNSLGNKKLDESYIKLKSLKAIREINLKYEFKQQHQNSPFTDSKNKFYQTKKELTYYLRQAIHGNNPCKNWNELNRYLNTKGITVEFKIKGKSDEIQGVSFAKGEFRFKGSELGRDLSYDKINKVFDQGIKVDSINNSIDQISDPNHELQTKSQSDSLIKLHLPSIGVAPEEDENINKRKRKRKF